MYREVDCCDKSLLLFFMKYLLVFANMENLDSDNSESPDEDYMEVCYSCGREFKEGQGRFRRPKGVFCIECYSDNNTESNSNAMSATLHAT